VAQQEAALRKLEAERDRLVAEVLTLQEAMSTSKACEECVDARAAARERAGPRRAHNRQRRSSSLACARPPARTPARTHARPPARTYARPHARTHAH
jgi:hypothetical protein